MANLSVGFLFFEADISDISWAPDLKMVIEITDHFQKLHGSDAADEALEYETYPHAKQKVLKRRGERASRAVILRG